MHVSVLSSGPLSRPALDALFGRESITNTPLLDVIYVTNTSHDISLAGLRFCPNLDAVCRIADDAVPGTRTAVVSLRDAGLIPTGAWGWLDDEALAQAVARTYRHARGTGAVAAAQQQWTQCRGAQRETAAVLPLTEEPIELHVLEPDGDGGQVSRHALRWIEDTDRREPEGFVVAGVDHADAAPGVLDAVRSADVVVLPPMSPILDMAGFLAVRGIRDALRGTSARVVALSPIGLDGHRPAGVDAASWRLTGATASSATLARLYADFVDALVIDDAEAPTRYPSSLTVTRAPMRAALAGDVDAAARLRAVVLGDAALLS